MADTTAKATRRGHGLALSCLLVAIATVSLSSCDLIREDTGVSSHVDADDVAAVAGWTRIALSPSYLLVVSVGVRHVEAHIYDRQTGIPLSNVSPTIRVFNRTTGDTIDVPPTLMQDVIIGGPDIHYGNNVAVRGDSDISVQVLVKDEEVTVDGHLD
jgi:hypothetical protein